MSCKLALFSTFAALLTHCVVALTPSQTGSCSDSKGFVAYFDYSLCADSKKQNWTAYAVSHSEAGVKSFGPVGGNAPTTVCITDDQFQGSLFVTNTSSMGTQQVVNVILGAASGSSSNGTQQTGIQFSGQAYVESRPDDQPGKVGTKSPKPIFAELTSFTFADNPSKALTSKSPATTVLETHKPHVAMYINYCGSPGIGPKSDTTSKPDSTKPDSSKPDTTKPDSSKPENKPPPRFARV